MSQSASEKDRRSGRIISRDQILQITGDIDDAKVAAILEAGATVGQLEEAVAWAAGQSDVLGPAERPLSGVVARLYDILTVDTAFYDDR